MLERLRRIGAAWAAILNREEVRWQATLGDSTDAAAPETEPPGSSCPAPSPNQAPSLSDLVQQRQAERRRG